MTQQEFDARIAHIEEHYQARREGADAYRDQEMARLFVECGWTQERIAEKLGKKQQWVSLRLIFGRFLSFTTDRCETEIDTSHLTEWQFRGLLSKVPGGRRGRGANGKAAEAEEQERFARVAEELAARAGAPVGHRNLVRKPGYRRELARLLEDGHWHTFGSLLAAMQSVFPDIDNGRLHNALGRRAAWGGRLELRRRKGQHQYRLLAEAPTPQAAGVAELIGQIRPFIKELKFWGTRHLAEISPQEILRAAMRLERLLNEALSPEHAASR